LKIKEKEVSPADRVERGGGGQGRCEQFLASWISQRGKQLNLPKRKKKKKKEALPPLFLCRNVAPKKGKSEGPASR